MLGTLHNLRYYQQLMARHARGDRGGNLRGVPGVLLRRPRDPPPVGRPLGGLQAPVGAVA